ncbi:MAG: BppU family phage baseplate upper protein [Clostridia bacterium]|nr:BppU family phage baseplate upper protein [Clostridia bacterium]
MKKSYYNITLDIKGIQSQAVLRVKQFDTSRVIYMSLTDGGKPYTIGDKCYAVFEAIKPDGTKVGNNCYIEKNKIVYEITEQTVAASGIANCEVSLYDADGGLITSPRFTLIIDRKLVTGDEFTSSSEYTSLVECLIRAEASEKEREDAEDERRDTWNTVLDSPKVWELKGGCIYRVSGFVAIDNEGVGFYVADKSLLVVNKDGDKTIFYLFLGGYGDFPYDIIIGATDGTTADWYGVESERKKVYEINDKSTHEGYPSPLAVYNFVNEALKNVFTQELSNDLKTFFNNIQTLLPQIAYVTEDNIGNAIIQNAKDIVSVLENQPSEEPEEPDTPTDKTLVSISATYTGGNVAAGKDVSSLTDVIVTATYSDGSTSDVTDYTLSGEIAEGENTIIVIYEGLTTTFTVIGEEVSIDENAVNIYTGFLGMDSTSTSEPTTNDTYPNAVCSEVMYKPSIGDGYDELYRYDVKLNSNITDTSKINWKTYDSSGARASSLTGDTIPNISSDYGIRLNIFDQTATADGSNAVIEGFTITVNAISGVKGIFEYGINDLRG